MPPSRTSSRSRTRQTSQESIAEAFGRVVRERRLELGLMQIDLEGDGDFHQTYISKLELGKLEPRLSAVMHLEDVLKLPPGELIRRVRAELEKGSPDT